MPNRIDCL